VFGRLAPFIASDAALEAFASRIARQNGGQRLELRIARRGPESIVAQVSGKIEKVPQSLLRNSMVPWGATFVGEGGIDAGGPARDLMNEFAASIFLPETGLTAEIREFHVPVPGVPVARQRALYRSIGLFLGMVARTGICQCLPFAPFVWNFLPAGQLSDSDILAGLPEFGEFVRIIRGAETHPEIEWTLKTWDGRTVVLPPHSPGELVEPGQIEAYVKASLRYLRDQVLPLLEALRGGFLENLGLQSVELAGSQLSRLCQGDANVTTAELRRITSYECN
jgi:hypothetical protein